MQNQTIEWEPYVSGGSGSRTLEGRFVTITATGAISISKELAEMMPPAKGWMRIEYAAKVKKLRLTPISTGVQSSLRMQMPGKGHSKGSQIRIGAGSGMKAWGLVPKVPTRYEAGWEGESLIVDLASPIGGEEERRVEDPIDPVDPIDVPSSVPSVSSVANPSPPPAIADDLIDMLMVTQLAQCAEPTLYAWMKGKGFPRPVERRGKKCFWSRTAVAQWLVSRGGQRKPRAGKSAAAKPTPTCATCGDFIVFGKRPMCRCPSKDNPNRNKSVAPSHTCDWHREPGVYRPVRQDEEE